MMTKEGDIGSYGGDDDYNGADSADDGAATSV